MQAGHQELNQPPQTGATVEIGWPTLAGASIGALSLIAMSPCERPLRLQGVPLQRPLVQRTAPRRRARPAPGSHCRASRAVPPLRHPLRPEVE